MMTAQRLPHVVLLVVVAAAAAFGWVAGWAPIAVLLVFLWDELSVIADAYRPADPPDAAGDDDPYDDPPDLR